VGLVVVVDDEAVSGVMLSADAFERTATGRVKALFEMMGPEDVVGLGIISELSDVRTMEELVIDLVKATEKPEASGLRDDEKDSASTDAIDVSTKVKFSLAFVY
jgi:hypothetical protein